MPAASRQTIKQYEILIGRTKLAAKCPAALALKCPAALALKSKGWATTFESEFHWAPDQARARPLKQNETTRRPNGTRPSPSPIIRYRKK